MWKYALMPLHSTESLACVCSKCLYTCKWNHYMFILAIRRGKYFSAMKNYCVWRDLRIAYNSDWMRKHMEAACSVFNFQLYSNYYYSNQLTSIVWTKNQSNRWMQTLDITTYSTVLISGGFKGGGGAVTASLLPSLALAIFSASRLFRYKETWICKNNFAVRTMHVLSEHSSTPWQIVKTKRVYSWIRAFAIDDDWADTLYSPLSKFVDPPLVLITIFKVRNARFKHGLTTLWLVTWWQACVCDLPRFIKSKCYNVKADYNK